MKTRTVVALVAAAVSLAAALSAARDSRVASSNASADIRGAGGDVESTIDRQGVAATTDNVPSDTTGNRVRTSTVVARDDSGASQDAAPDRRTAMSVEPIAIPAYAATSLADAMRNGDDRAPPIERHTGRVVAPSPGELADPRAYRRYQARQHARLYATFEREAVIALGDMQRDLQRARAEHVSPELLAEGEEKARRLAETLEALRQPDLDAPP